MHLNKRIAPLVSMLEKNPDATARFIEKIATIINEEAAENFNAWRERFGEDLRLHFEQEKEKLIKSDLRMVAVDKAIKQACSAAGVDKFYADGTFDLPNYTDKFARTQLIRTIGVIWSAALGMKSILDGTNTKEEDGQ